MLYAADKGKAAGRREPQQSSQDRPFCKLPCQFAGPNSGKPIPKEDSRWQSKIKKAEMQSIEAHRDVCMRENLRVLEERERERACVRQLTACEELQEQQLPVKLPTEEPEVVSGMQSRSKAQMDLNLHNQRLMNRQVYVSGFGGH